MVFSRTQTGQMGLDFGDHRSHFQPGSTVSLRALFVGSLGRCLRFGTHRMAHTENQLESQNSQTCVWRPAKIGASCEHMGRRETGIRRDLCTRSRRFKSCRPGDDDLLTCDGPRLCYETPQTIAEGLALYSQDQEGTKTVAWCRVYTSGR